MGLVSIKKRVASRIAKSRPKNIAARFQHRSMRHIAMPCGRCRSSTSVDVPVVQTQEVGSVTSILPILQLSLDDTKIITRSCLKKPRSSGIEKSQSSSSSSGSAQPAKHVGFVYDDALLTCLVSGTRIMTRVSSAERHKAFIQRGEDKFQMLQNQKLERRLDCRADGVEGAENSSSDEAKDNGNVEIQAESPNDDDDDNIFDLTNPEDKILKEHITAAKRNKNVQTARTVGRGILDFALYVTREAEALKVLEDIALDHTNAIKIASYRGEERRHALCGNKALTTLPARLYESYGDAMSGNRELSAAGPQNTEAAPATDAKDKAKMETPKL